MKSFILLFSFLVLISISGSLEPPAHVVVLSTAPGQGSNYEGNDSRKELIKVIIQKLITCNFDESQLVTILAFITRLDHSSKYSKMVSPNYGNNAVSYGSYSDDYSYNKCNWDAVRNSDGFVASYRALAKILPNSGDNWCNNVYPLLNTPKKITNLLYCKLGSSVTRYMNNDLGSFATLCPHCIKKEEFTIPILSNALPKVVPSYSNFRRCIQGYADDFDRCEAENLHKFTCIENIVGYEKKAEQLCCAARAHEKCFERVASTCEYDAGQFVLFSQAKHLVANACKLCSAAPDCYKRNAYAPGRVPYGEGFGTTVARIMDDVEKCGPEYNSVSYRSPYGYNG